MIFALVAGALLAVGGGALDMARAARERAAMQEAADAAALAAMRTFKKSKDERDRAAMIAFARNYRIAESESLPKLEINYRGESVTVAAVRNVPTSLLKAVGVSSLSARAFSEATLALATPICILALDEDLPNGLEIYGNASLTARNCAAVSNSSNDRGMRTYGNARAIAEEFAVAGNFEGTFTPMPRTNNERVPDPFAALRLPPSGSCVNAEERLRQSNFTLSPGTYCGGLTISAGATVRLDPGLYVMRDGAFEVRSGARVIAEEATIAFAGKDASLYLQGGGELKIVAPRQGPFTGLALFSESTSPHVEWATVSGGAVLEIIGTMYQPTHEIWVKSPAKDQASLLVETSGHGLVAKRFWVQGNASIEVAHVDPDARDVHRLKTGARLVR